MYECVNDSFVVAGFQQAFLNVVTDIFMSVLQERSILEGFVELV